MTAPRSRPSILHSRLLQILSLLLLTPLFARTEVDVYIPDVPDYSWYAGCTGTCLGMIAAYWDRHGFPNMYTGPTGGGLAPLDNFEDNFAISALWATRAGLDGRPTNAPGHVDDYWTYYSPANAWPYSYESTGQDPYQSARRSEHAADCIGDFIGLSMNRWTNMNNECDGNIDSYAFVFWDNSGNKRVNYVPPLQNGSQPKDVQSGLRAWAKSRGYSATVFSQLVDFNTNVPPGKGFTFADYKAEIDAGYPVMFFQQSYARNYRYVSNPIPVLKGNPAIHSVVGYGYYIGDDDSKWVRFFSSWGDGENFKPWDTNYWLPSLYLPVRGVCGFRPSPKIVSVTRQSNNVTIAWHGPAGQLTDNLAGVTTNLHYYVVERSSSVKSTNFVAVTTPSTAHTATINESRTNAVFYRVRLVGR